ncbi:membrane protein [Pedobacter lusitanus]|uniref:Probable membrane transporter protein n=1 Tax=Pedobacter lusitanus TaxID=1503925 RepID=A0A0D0GME9_9SPHI|nr:sulfite exporter TauE/SafE family protein [Pedobacter lusitanus]KIO75646.1 membrane protein [Pedobacter lusitanus]
MYNLTLLFFIGMLAGAMNAVAGGGSFITFPALLYAGVPAVSANASSTAALFPASLVSAWEFKEYIRPFPDVSMKLMIVLTFAGGCTGALLLLHTTSASFTVIVPWLLLTGAMAFAFGKQLGNQLRRKIHIGSGIVLSGQFLLGIYGGYFGGAVGIMMMAMWSLFGLSDIKVINANKTLFVGIANAIAVVLFIIAGKVAWSETCVMLIATILGGYFGARYTKQMNPVKLRMSVIIFNFVITAIFFIRVYL